MDEIIPDSHWLSLGHSQEYADAMTCLQITLNRGISDLKRLGQSPPETELGTITIHGGGAGPLLPDDSLLPLWKEFARALCSLATYEYHGFIRLIFADIQLPTEVLDVLEPVLRTAPLDRLFLCKNSLGRDGIKFMTHLLETNTSISNISLGKNEITFGRETFFLLEAARNHPRLRLCDLDQCCIGHILSTTPEMVSSLLSLKAVLLKSNCLGSHAASLISNCLATNPDIMILELDDNLLNDDDATLFANSLKDNTNLISLSLHGNNFTDAGIKTLYRSIYDDQSFNAICECNHTCELVLFPDGQPTPNGIDESVLSMNGKHLELDDFSVSVRRRCFRDSNADAKCMHELLQMEGRRKIKMLHALQGGNSGHFNMQYLNSVPTELMPKVLAFLQECGKYSGIEERNLDSLFQVLRARPGTVSSRGVHGTSHGSQQQCKKRRLS